MSSILAALQNATSGTVKIAGSDVPMEERITLVSSVHGVEWVEGGKIGFRFAINAGELTAESRRPYGYIRRVNGEWSWHLWQNGKQIMAPAMNQMPEEYLLEGLKALPPCILLIDYELIETVCSGLLAAGNKHVFGTMLPTRIPSC